MRFITYLFAVIFLFHMVLSFNDYGTFDIASFNVQVFGLTKMKDANVRKNLVKIILRYDLILIQEIRDSSGNAIVQLLSLVNAASSKHYDMVISGRLGRTTSKEQYAIIYRTDWVHIESVFTYTDPKDVFEREPFVVKVRTDKLSIPSFVIAAIHTSPDDAELEISALTHVYDDIKVKLKTDDVIIMGDFNAGCSYVSDWKNVSLATDNRFYWLIDSSKDTTTKGTDCPYDRIVVAGENLLKAVIPQSVGVFHYDEAYGLSEETTLDISDHFPVYMQLRSIYEKENIDDKEVVSTADDSKTILKSAVRRARDLALSQGYLVSTKYTKTGAQQLISISKEALGRLHLTSVLSNYLHEFSEILTKSVVDVTYRQLEYNEVLSTLPRGYGKYQTLYDFYKHRKVVYEVTVACDMSDEPCDCTFSIKY